jgi:putative PIN family toxin of toxin-antitoxin system
MIVVIDTNVVLTMFKPSRANRPIFEAWVQGALRWAVSTDILLEYEETAARMAPPAYAALIFQVVDAVDAARANVLRVSPTFRFHVITADADDNKFADCAIVAEADLIITEDRHFDVLCGSGYKPQSVTPEAFIQRHLGGE